MKKLNCVCLAAVLLFSTAFAGAQNPEWIYYLNGEHVNALAEEGNQIWAGTSEGLVRIDKTSGLSVFYDSSNSGLPENWVRTIAVDGSGNKWIGTAFGGMALFDGTNWTVFDTSNSGLPNDIVNSIVLDGSGNSWIGTYNGLGRFDGTNWTKYFTSNSELPHNEVNSIAIDGSGNKWIGTRGGGVALFDGTNWTTYNSSNSGLPFNRVNSIAIDGSGNKWIGTEIGLARFDGTNWITYNSSNLGLPNDIVNSIDLDGSGNKWIGAEDGLARFDGTNWTAYTTSNSGMPSNTVRSLIVDESGNKWVGTYRGLGVYKEGGVVAVDDLSNEQLPTPNKFTLAQNYPNPFNPSTTISFSASLASHVTIVIYDVLGREVKRLADGLYGAGKHTVIWEGTNNAGQRVAAGMYIYRVTSGDFAQSKKMILLK
jgi:ligand-binding sensor domain-containing protein